MNTRVTCSSPVHSFSLEEKTEEQAVPDFAEKYWGKHPNDLGYSLLASEAKGITFPFLRWR